MNNKNMYYVCRCQYITKLHHVFCDYDDDYYNDDNDNVYDYDDNDYCWSSWEFLYTFVCID